MEDLLQMIKDGPGKDITEDPYIIESYEYIEELLRQACIAMHTKIVREQGYGNRMGLRKDGTYLHQRLYTCIMDVMQQNDLAPTQLSQNYPITKLQFLKGKHIVTPLLDFVIRKKTQTEADKVNFAAIYVRKASDPKILDVRTVKSDMARLAYLVINEGCRFAFFVWVGTLEEIRWMDVKTQVAIPHPNYKITEVCINKYLDLIPRIGKPVPASIAKTVILNQVTPECCVRLYRIEPDLISQSHDLDDSARIDKFYRELHHFKYDLDSHDDLLADLRLRLMRAKDYWEAKLVDNCDAALTSLRVIMAELLYTKTLNKKEQAELSYLQKHYYYIDQFLYEDNMQRMMEYERGLMEMGLDEIELLRIRVNCFRYDSDYHLMTINQTTFESLDEDPRPLSPFTQGYYKSIKPRTPPPLRERKSLLPVLESLKDWQQSKYPLGVFRPKSHKKELESLRETLQSLHPLEKKYFENLEDSHKPVTETVIPDDAASVSVLANNREMSVKLKSKELGTGDGKVKKRKSKKVKKLLENESGNESDSSKGKVGGKKRIKKKKTVLKEEPTTFKSQFENNKVEKKETAMVTKSLAEENDLETDSSEVKKGAKKKLKKKITAEVFSVPKIVKPRLENSETGEKENSDSEKAERLKNEVVKKKGIKGITKKGLKIRGKKKKKKKVVTELERSTLSPVDEASEPDSDYY